jgi:hypothetical protein
LTNTAIGFVAAWRLQFVKGSGFKVFDILTERFGCQAIMASTAGHRPLPVDLITMREAAP